MRIGPHALMNKNNQTSKPAGFLFDQWSRYDAAARAVRAILPDGGTVLDVGCGQQMLLGSFLPDHQLTYLDPLLAGKDAEHIIGRRLTPESVQDGRYDIVVSVDALEHIPADVRPAFLSQLIRASKRGVVIAAPFADAGDAKSTDDSVHEAYRAKCGHDYSWLREHEEYGLPSLATTLAQLHEAGLFCTTFGNGHTPWLKDLLATHVRHLDLHAHVPVLRKIGTRFAADLMQFDHLEPTYRQVIIADRTKASKVSLEPVHQAVANAAWHQFKIWVEAQLALHADELVQTASAERKRAQTMIQQQQQQLLALHSQVVRAEAKAATTHDETGDLRQHATTCKRRADESARALQRAQQDLNTMRRSFCWRLTAPIRLTGNACAAGVTKSRAATLKLATWSVQNIIPERLKWPLKNAFFTLGKPLLKNSREYVEFVEAKRWRDRPSPPPALTIAPPHNTLADVLVFGVIDWQLRIQRPQQLALQLAARGHRVIYLSPSFVQHNRPGYQIVQVAAHLPVYQVHLHTQARTSIYEGPPPAALRDNLVEGLRQLLGSIGVHTNLCIVDHPGWVEIAQLVPRSQLLYDCMDNHHGFQESGSQLPAAEQLLITASDAVIVTSDHIAAAVRPRHSRVAMIRNACAPEHFFAAASQPSTGRRAVIGYFGAIAEWFDVYLLEQVAGAMPDCDFLMVGGDTAKVQERLRNHKNVQFTGEVEYQDLPEFVHRMDVLLIPFLINELTLATNPVKAYEALAAGKPVVATPMPELMDTDLAPFVRIGQDKAEIQAALRAAIAESANEDQRQRRITFARQQTWSHRVEDLLAVAAELPMPRVAVVIVTWNGLELSKRCVRSVLDDPLAPDLDVIIVDNASSDATPAWLDEIELDPRVRVVRNEDNRGFAAACNQGLAAGAERDADMLVILNNDIVVTPGWAATLHRHLQHDASIGLIGPVTNNIGNEAKIDTAYESLEAMQPEQRSLTGRSAGKIFDIRVLAFFCVAMPRDVFKHIGALDENFGTGFFEDDDYCQRVRQLNRRIVCAEDVFVHHELSASFGKLPSADRQHLFDRNKAYYESKWGPWQRHVYRPKGNDQNAAAS